jgi:DNA-binding phage protein
MQTTGKTWTLRDTTVHDTTKDDLVIVETSGRFGLAKWDADRAKFLSVRPDEDGNTIYAQKWAERSAKYVVMDWHEAMSGALEEARRLYSGDVYDSIRAKVAESGMTYTSIAERNGWTRGQLDQRLRAKSPSLDTLLGIAGALGITVSELIGE